MNYPIKSISRFGEIKATLNQPTLYIFEGKQGQHLTLGVSDGTSRAKLLTPSGQGLTTLYSGEWKGVLPESGIYRVLVYPQQESTHSAIKVDLSQNLSGNSSHHQFTDWRLSEYAYKGSRSAEIGTNQSEIQMEINLFSQQIQPLKITCKSGQILTVKANTVSLAIQSPTGQLLDLKEGFVLTSITQDGVYKVLVIGEDYPVTTPITVKLQ
ncbi:MAG: hypothetical protein WAN66_26965 [Limnoraphis robusta]|uniref:Uncharacterized protein n=1 Tax=Limnoraphis robusta CS-951 TaxID=1637645 RepID=A0A0F5Y7Z9_9CYAN|nr:hypothetical protein [Limnoraphis robusta]KKD34757.1 hypothetical protein WN50_29110 [Limnoraphis robusta CS-951]MEA5498687.1 hypothetical protein [Limnoraphis robusta BA-68 BA1]MEA5538417.1 hypothetical protein [Limnoraphis robusta Tam1]